MVTVLQAFCCGTWLILSCISLEYRDFQAQMFFPQFSLCFLHIGYFPKCYSKVICITFQKSTINYLVDTIQGLCIMLGMKVCINWISRSNLSERINIVRSTNIIKEVSKVWAYGTTIGHFLNYFSFWYMSFILYVSSSNQFGKSDRKTP